MGSVHGQVFTTLVRGPIRYIRLVLLINIQETPICVPFIFLLSTLSASLHNRWKRHAPQKDHVRNNLVTTYV
jgi:hypothetical protein